MGSFTIIHKPVLPPSFQLRRNYRLVDNGKTAHVLEVLSFTS
jgi:hypothetical protein